MKQLAEAESALVWHVRVAPATSSLVWHVPAMASHSPWLTFIQEYPEWVILTWEQPTAQPVFRARPERVSGRAACMGYPCCSPRGSSLVMMWHTARGLVRGQRESKVHRGGHVREGVVRDGAHDVPGEGEGEGEGEDEG